MFRFTPCDGRRSRESFITRSDVDGNLGGGSRFRVARTEFRVGEMVAAWVKFVRNSARRQSQSCQKIPPRCLVCHSDSPRIRSSVLLNLNGSYRSAGPVRSRNERDGVLMDLVVK